VYEKFSRVPAEIVEAGDICAVCGISDIQVDIVLLGSTDILSLILLLFSLRISDTWVVFLVRIDWSHFFTQIGETIADKISGKPLPAIKVEEPTVKMAFSINTSPFVGREVFLYETLYMAFFPSASSFLWTLHVGILVGKTRLSMHAFSSSCLH
jgi:GTP-binding protein